MPITRSPMPLYYQVANEIETAIVAGDYAKGSYLPSEKQLARQFGVSVITVRSAMSALIDKGMVERQRGKGTVVTEKSNSVWELGWLSELITSVLASRLDVISAKNVKAPSWVARRFGIPTGETVHFMSTVRRAAHRGNEPFMTTELYHPREIGERLTKCDFEDVDVQRQLVIMTVEERCRIRIASVRQTMSAELAEEPTCSLLQMERGRPLLVVTRDYFRSDGRLVQTGRSRYRTDHYEYVLNIARGHGQNSGPASAENHQPAVSRGGRDRQLKGER